MKKYELIPSNEPNMFRVKALISFGTVVAGDIGGYVEGEHNLSQDGNAWVYGNAWVSGNAHVSDNAYVSDYARVSGNARVYGSARVYDDACVYDDARVYGSAHVYGNAHVYDYACVYGYACVSEVCTKTPITLCGLKFNVTITDRHMRCGCQCHTFEVWERMSDDKIRRMDPNAYDFMLKYRSVLKTLIDNHKISS